MSYTTLTWVDRSKDTPGTKLNASNLNHIEKGIKDLYDALDTITNKIPTDAQLGAISNFTKSLGDLQTELDKLKTDFNAHVHSNEAGDTTGGVTTDPTATTSTTDSSSTNGQDSNKAGN
jgi:hypothetical protein